jgi:serine/threonine-protein kinase
MFLDEARIAARLNHPNVVQIFDLGAQDDSFFIAMEYIHGEDARRVWKQAERLGTAIPQALICRMVIEACTGLDYAHKKADQSGRPLNIVHRDISPQNILVSFEGGVKIVDFGIAKAADQATVTRSGVLKGKYSYMSPEQAAGVLVDHRTDIFALGVVLYELLTGARLFKRATDIQTLNAVTECIVPPPSSANPEIPPELDAIVMKALAKDRTQRYQEARHLAAALESWLLKNQMPSSGANLAEFLHSIYADRLAREAEEGRLLVETVDGSRNDEQQVALATPSVQDPDPRRTRSQISSRPPVKTGSKLEAARKPPTASVPVQPRDRESTSAERPSKPNPLPRPVPQPATAEHSALQRTEASMPTQNDDRSNKGAIVGIAGAAAVAIAIFAFLLTHNALHVNLASTPPGALVAIDGRNICHTPCQLPEPVPGPLTLTLSREGFENLTAQLTVPARGTLTVPAFALVPKTTAPPKAGIDAGATTPKPTGDAKTVNIAADPSSAKISLAGGEPQSSPAAVRLMPGEKVAVLVELEGYQSVTELVGDETSMHVITLKPVEVKKDPVDPKKDPVKKDFRGTPVVVVKNPIVPVKKDPEVKQPSGVGSGVVRFVVKPWAKVECPPYRFGDTPFAEQPMKEGDYTCRFTNPEFADKTLLVHVEAGRTQKVFVDFGQ